jgi:hypothetical protein
MSLDEVKRGQRKFRDLVHAHAPEAGVEIGAASPQEMYPVTIVRPGKVYWFSIAAEDFEDLANNGRVRVNLEGVIGAILASEPVWRYTCANCSRTVALYTRSAWVAEAGGIRASAPPARLGGRDAAPRSR